MLYGLINTGTGLRVGYGFASLMLVFACMAAFNHGYAMIHGVTYPTKAVSTVRIRVEQAHYLHSSNRWEPYESMCSAVITGLNPLTLLTASHCLKEVRLNADTKLPEVSILNLKRLGIDSPRLVKAFYHPYDEIADNLTKDIAVLVFDVSPQISSNIQAVPIQMAASSLKTTALLCGFGKGYREADAEEPRCSEKKLLLGQAEFRQILPEVYAGMDEMLYIKSKAQFEYLSELVVSPPGLLFVHRLDARGEYHESLSMATDGDSGGSWLIQSEQGQYQLVAITSFVERFYNKSPYWGFFDRNVPLSDYPYVACGLWLGGEAVKRFLIEARSAGADMQFLENVPQVKPP